MRRRLAPLALALAAAAVANAAGGLPLPADVRIALVFGALVLAPGLLILRLLRSAPPGGPVLTAGWALGAGVAWAGAHALLLHLAGASNHLLPVAGSVTTLGLGLGLALRPGAHSTPAPALGRASATIVLLAAAATAFHVARHGPALNTYTDSPDHVGTLRRILASGDAFPSDAFFRDAGPAGIDPRKALWHPVAAALAGAAGADPLEAWRVLAACLAPLLVLNMAALGHRLGGATTAALAAVSVPLVYGGGVGTPYLGEAVFSTKLADQLALAALTAVLADLDQPSPRARTVAVVLALGATFTHVFAAIHLAVVLGALGVALVVRDRGWRGEAPRLAGTGLVLAGVLLPFLAWRAHGAYAPVNVIHTEAQGLLRLPGGLFVVSPGVLWDWMGRTWWLWPACTPWLLARGRQTPSLALGAAAVAVAVLLFVPPVPQWLQPRLGYLPMRFVWMLPTAALAGLAIDRAARAVLRGPRRGAPGVALAGIAFVLLPSLRDAVREAGGGSREREPSASRDMMRWRPALERLERALPPGAVVLTDPATSYAIPMTTGLHVVTLVDQHSSPNDSLALTRILDARDALAPDGGGARTAEVIRRHGVDAILLNGRFTETPRLDYWTADAEWFARARRRFDARPDAFPVLFDEGDLVAYAVRREVADTLAGPEPERPFVRAYDPERDRPLGPPRAGSPELVGATGLPASAFPGDTLALALAWHVRSPLPAGAYDVSVRLDRERDSRSAPAWLGKPGRKLLERLRHERQRARTDHLPVDGALGVDRWRPSGVVLDSVRVPVPADLAPGTWRVEVRMHRQPHYPILDWRDYLSDRDYFSGDPIGTLRLGPRGRAESAR